LKQDFLKDFHWLMDVLQNVDVGLLILNRKFEVELWNGFMQNHSARMSNDVLGNNIFKLFPELPEAWFKRKIESVLVLKNSAFTTWEQRPYLFRFQSYRPITSIAEYMYQNSTIIPITNTRGDVEHICVIIYDVTEVAINRLQLQEANVQLQKLSRTDGLTGLLNRKAWEMELSREFQRFKRYRRSSSMIMMDIDHFKAVNDNHGHPMGDAVIRKTALSLMQNMREIDIAGRYGGEEFAVILIDTNTKGAALFAERLRKVIESLTVTHNGVDIHFTISLGVAELDETMSTPVDWIDSADKALYEAKNTGRNRFALYNHP